MDGVPGGVRDRHQLAGGRGEVQRREGVPDSCLVVGAGDGMHGCSYGVPAAGQYLPAAARLTRSGRRRRLKISATWPWAPAIATAWDRISALAPEP